MVKTIAKGSNMIIQGLYSIEEGLIVMEEWKDGILIFRGSHYIFMRIIQMLFSSFLKATFAIGLKSIVSSLWPQACLVFFKTI